MILGVTTLGMVLAVIAALSIACTSLSIRLGTDDGDPTAALVVVLGCNVAILVPIAAMYASAAPKLSLESALWFAAAGLTGTLLGRICYFTSITRIGSSRTEPIKATQPLHATVIAVLLFGERVTALHFAGIVLIIVGVAVVSREVSRNGSASGPNSRRALLPGFAAAVFFGLEPILAKLGFADSDALFAGLTLRIVVAAAAFLAYLWFRDALPAMSQLGGTNARWYVAAGVANTLFLLSYYGALQIAPVSIVVPIIQTSPLVVMVLALLFLPDQLERVTRCLAAAAAIVVVGAVAVTLFS